MILSAGYWGQFAPSDFRCQTWTWRMQCPSLIISHNTRFCQFCSPDSTSPHYGVLVSVTEQCQWWFLNIIYFWLATMIDCEIYIPDSWHWHVADTTWQDNDIHRNHMNHMNIQSQRRLCYVVVTYHTNTNYWHDSDCDFLTEFAAYLAYCDTETEVASGFSRWWWRQQRWRLTRSIELCSITRGQGPLQQYRKTSKSKTFSLSKSKSVQSDRPWQTHMIHET